MTCLILRHKDDDMITIGKVVHVDLGKLKGNVASQNYEIPPDIEISEFGSIVIYCEPFHVLFASASLTP